MRAFSLFGHSKTFVFPYPAHNPIRNFISAWNPRQSKVKQKCKHREAKPPIHPFPNSHCNTADLLRLRLRNSKVSPSTRILAHYLRMRRQAASTVAEQVVGIAEIVQAARIRIQRRGVRALVNTAALARASVVALARDVRGAREADGGNDVLGVGRRERGLGGEGGAAEGVADDLAALGVAEEDDLGGGARGGVGGDCFLEVDDARVLRGFVVVEGGGVWGGLVVSFTLWGGGAYS